MAIKRHVLTKIHFKMQTVTFDGLTIEKCNDDAFYITLGDLVVYIDNGTGENYVSSWLNSNESVTFQNIHTPQ
jgi:hypothetical protein